MRLHLNKTLRAALIAAITAVGTTLPQSFAAGEPVTTDLFTVDGWTKSNMTIDTSNQVASNKGWNKGHAYMTLDSAYVLPAGQDTYLDFSYQIDLNFNGCVTFTLIDSKNSISLTTGWGQYNDGGHHVGYGTTSVTNPDLLYQFKDTGDGKCKVTEAGYFDYGSQAQNNTPYTSQVDGHIAWDDTKSHYVLTLTNTQQSEDPVTITYDLGVSSLNFDKVNICIEGRSGGSDYYKMTELTTTYAAPTAPVVSDYVWSGSVDANWDKTTENWLADEAAAAYVNGKNAFFTSAGAEKTVAVKDAIVAGNLTVDNAEYTFNIEEGASLSVGKIDIVGSASKLSINSVGATTLSLTALANEGELHLGAGVAVVATGSNVTLTADHGLGVTGEGSISIGTMTASGGTHTLSVGISAASLETSGGANVTFNGTLNSITGAIHTKSGASTSLSIGTGDTDAILVVNRLELGDNASGGAANFVIGEHGKVVVKSANNETGYKAAGLLFSEWGQSTHAQIAGELYAKDAMLSTGDKAATIDISGTVATKGIRGIKNVNNTINLAEGGVLVLGASGITADNNGTWAINLNGGEVGISENATIARALNVAGDVTFNTQLYTWVGSDAAQEIEAGQEGGTITISGNISGNGTITKTGAGELILSGGSNVINNTIQVQKGTLTMTGTYEIGGIKGGDIQEYYVDVDGKEATNGFYCQAGSKTVYSAEGATVNDNGAKYTIGGVEVAVTGGVITIDPTVDYTTLWVRDGSEAFAAYKTKAGEALTKVDLAAGTSVNMDYDTASITLEMHGDATVNATAAATISSISGWENHTLNVDGTSEVTLANLTTLTGSSALEVKGGTLNTKKFMLNSADASLKVNDGTTMNVTGDLTPTHGSVEVAGAVNISGSLDLSNGGNSNVELDITSTGEVMAGSMWMAAAAAVALEQGGTFNIANMQIVGKDGGRISTTTNNVLYGSNNGAFVIENATITATGNVTIGNTLSGVDVVVADGSSLTLKTAADSVTVNAGGTINKGEGGSFSNLTIEDGGIIGTGLDNSEVGIAADVTVTFAQGIEDSGVEFYGEDGVQVKNTGGESIHYTIDEENAKVTADTLIAAGENPEDTIVVNNEVNVSSIANWGDAALTLTHIGTETHLESISTIGGQVTLQGVTTDPIALTDLSIGAGSTVAVYTDEHATTEGTVTVSETLTAGGATLLANLEMADGSKLDVNGGDAMALTLGSEFNLAEGAIVTLDEETLAAIANLENIGDKVILVKQYQDHALTTNLEDGDWSRTHFDLSSITNADYKLYVQDGQIGLVKSSNVPEPTTGTLSLLALAALAARRRKH
ncbi:MAG: hypothetical protein MJ056_01765 [Akkermansia sp.]|nr:hypothetical protein [Akkermansia sp.]